jgi:hypothetical protein
LGMTARYSYWDDDISVEITYCLKKYSFHTTPTPTPRHSPLITLRAITHAELLSIRRWPSLHSLTHFIALFHSIIVTASDAQ